MKHFALPAPRSTDVTPGLFCSGDPSRKREAEGAAITAPGTHRQSASTSLFPVTGRLQSQTPVCQTDTKNVMFSLALIDDK